jgi:hypothetical protein
MIGCDAAVKDPERPLVAPPGCGFVAFAAADDSERPECWNELGMDWAQRARPCSPTFSEVFLFALRDLETQTTPRVAEELSA